MSTPDFSFNLSRHITAPADASASSDGGAGEDASATAAVVTPPAETASDASVSASQAATATETTTRATDATAATGTPPADAATTTTTADDPNADPDAPDAVKNHPAWQRIQAQREQARQEAAAAAQRATEAEQRIAAIEQAQQQAQIEAAQRQQQAQHENAQQAIQDALATEEERLRQQYEDGYLTDEMYEQGLVVARNAAQLKQNQQEFARQQELLASQRQNLVAYEKDRQWNSVKAEIPLIADSQEWRNLAEHVFDTFPVDNLPPGTPPPSLAQVAQSLQASIAPIVEAEALKRIEAATAELKRSHAAELAALQQKVEANAKAPVTVGTVAGSPAVGNQSHGGIVRAFNFGQRIRGNR